MVNTMNKVKINWLTKWLLKFWPSLAMRFLSRKSGTSWALTNKLHRVLGQVNRVDITPTVGGRGFVIILDSKISLHFYQDHDHFAYDGFEVGEYEGGDVTIFDNINNPVSNSRE